ncbi:MAG TPA: fibronectin type III domain-containing protein [Tepidisphaeraceae bacterium]|nr:fibronectin type III domain-containing protein [Tepidisphaeraceae bacterium]
MPAFRRSQLQVVPSFPIHQSHAECSLLESRVFLDASPLSEEYSEQQWHVEYDAAADIAPLVQATSAVDLGLATSGTALSALSAIPVLNSKPDATAQIYLDFDGDAASSWGEYSVWETPAYDRDGDETTFSSSELAAIEEIWARVAEKYSPFNINVTTVNPGALTDRVALRVVIGGDGMWFGGDAGGVAYIGGFRDYSPNTVYVFPDNLGYGEPKYVAEAAAHEAGHGFGLEHQSLYASDGRLLQEYYEGTGSVAPIMGNSYDARGVWWNGTTLSPWDYQNDLAVLASQDNGFGYRVDDHGNTLASASTMALEGSTLTASGIIEKMTDVDSFAFTAGTGPVNFSINVAAKGAMLDLKVALYKTDGTLVAVANTASLGETLATNVTAGSYRLLVMSRGRYGDVGQYTITGTIVPGMEEMALAPEAPTGLMAQPLSQGRMMLVWDPVQDATGYIVERSADGTKWNQAGTTAELITWYTDRDLTPGATYYYRVRAMNGGGESEPSEIVKENASLIEIPAAPAKLQMFILSNYTMRLTWQDQSSNERGFRIQWSPDGRHWYGLGCVAANRTGVNLLVRRRGTTYFRVSAYNQYGQSAFSATTSTATARRVYGAFGTTSSSVFSTRFIVNQPIKRAMSVWESLSGLSKAA